MTRKQKEKLVLAIREKKIRLSRDSLWSYSNTLSPDFYVETRHHLVTIINTLQLLYEGKLLKHDGTPYKKLMMSVPPRHGKSRSLINFASWVLGKNPANRIITTSYNDELAMDFSKYTRNTISEAKERPHEIVYSDIFPDTRIKHGDASYKQWALDGQFFTYKGAGVTGAITGKGATILIGDDLVKDAATAFNELELEKIWKWYTGTFLSRAEEGAIQILCMTRWSKNDPIGKLLDSTSKDEWYVLNMEAYDEDTNQMLCPELLSHESYLSLKANMDPLVFQANYHNHLVDQKGRLYTELREYLSVPIPIEIIKAQVDTADTGKDYTCCVIYKLCKGLAYIIDIYYSTAPMEITEPKVAELLFTHKVQVADIESNNGGRGFARNVERILWETHKSRQTRVVWYHQAANKIAKILSNATTVMNAILFPINWQATYKDAYLSMISYMRDGKNAHDDLQDTLSEIAIKLSVPNRSTVVSKKSLGL